ncbi:MAG: DUF4174 domain-containing protein [Alphaproteobacteria bacterium]|nr:DUF4174 domain-containing protein [Alphaproteobacteria bacterium]
MAFLLGVISMTGPSHAQSEDLSEYLWTNRPLAVFAPSRSDPVAGEQIRILSGTRACMRARDMVVVEVIGSDVMIEGAPSMALKAATLRQRYGIEDNKTAVLLIGKDGGVKMRRASAIPLQDLFETIDKMPMRMREARLQMESGRESAPDC